MARIFLHIGHYKTGTTALQAWCAEHEAALAARGLLYAQAGRGASAPTNHANLSLPLAQRHGFRPPIWYQDAADPDETFAELRAEISRQKPRNTLISSEEFVQLALAPDPGAAIADLRARLPGRVRIIFTAREPLALLISWYAQVNRGVKPRHTFLTFVAELATDFAAQVPIVDRFGAVFGRRHVTVLHHGDDLLAQLLRATGTRRLRAPGLATTNVTDDTTSLEQRRYAKMTGGPPDMPDVPDMRVTGVDHIDALDHVVAQINAGFARLRRRSRQVPHSRLTTAALIDHYLALLTPAARQIALAPDEAEALAALARTAPGSVAAQLDRAAQIIVRSQSNRGPAP